MSATAIFGGTFNPVHNGHIRLLKLVNERFGFDRIIIMPAKVPPHKDAPQLASEQHRSEMCRLAFDGMENAEVSDFEINNEGKSYSVITLRHFHKIYPDDKLYFIMGSDMLLSFEKWYCYEEILSLAALVCISRSEADTALLEPYAQKLREKGGEVIIIEEKPFEVSSTMLRKMIKEKNSTNLYCYLPENVVKYILDNNLYI